jgi:hypothetical protein
MLANSAGMWQEIPSCEVRQARRHSDPVVLLFDLLQRNIATNEGGSLLRCGGDPQGFHASRRSGFEEDGKMAEFLWVVAQKPSPGA